MAKQIRNKNEEQSTTASQQLRSNMADDAIRIQPTSGAATTMFQGFRMTLLEEEENLPHGLYHLLLRTNCFRRQFSGANTVIIAPVPNTQTKLNNKASNMVKRTVYYFEVLPSDNMPW